jgi:signal transduction histidine kinase
MYALPFFHLTGENSLLKNILDENEQEIFLVQAETLEVIFINKTARNKLGIDAKTFPVNISRLGDDYQLGSFKGLVFPLLNGSIKEIVLLTNHKDHSGKNYPVEVKIIYNTLQGFSYFLMTAKDCSERNQLEKEIKQKKAELEKLSFELDKFVYSASHDLLAPICTLKGLIQLNAKENPVINEQHKCNPDYVLMMNKTVDKLEHYIHDMIDFSKNMRQEVGGDAVNFKNMIAITLDNLRYTEGFDSMNFQVEVSQEEDFFSDEKRLMMLLNNLISNAIKYRNPNVLQSALNISVKLESKKATIRLQDNGIGISKESIDRIFEMFYRASSNSYGSGLGLYIVKEVLKKLKGKIQVASTPGMGTEFLLEIPNKIPRTPVHRPKKSVKPFKTAL